MAAPKGNKYAEGLENSGRPPVYEDAEYLSAKIKEYFEYVSGEFVDVTYTEEDSKGKKKEHVKTICVREPENPTLTGLALFLGFCSRQSLYDYKDKKEFSYIIKRATTVIESHHENNLGEKSPTGAIFALKNMGWKDSQNVDHTTKGEAVNIINLGSGKKPNESTT